MLDLIARIRARLANGSYANEAGISHGVVTPILNALGWDSSDPDQMLPEFSSGKGRVDFALLGLGRRPGVFIEVKNVGRAVDADRQLFEYAFHKGVPLCVLTDGREWSFYLPGGQGTYEDRRVYRLQLDDRQPAECESVLVRYLARERVRSGAAYEDAQRDYRDAAGKREASAALPRAWTALLAEREENLLDLVADKAEALCGFRPVAEDVLAFPGRLEGRPGTAQPQSRPRAVPKPSPPSTAAARQPPTSLPPPPITVTVEPGPVSGSGRSVTYRVLGKEQTSANGSDALVRILGMLCARDPARLPDLATAAEGRSRRHIGRSASEIYPDRPDLTVAEFHPGWFVGLNVANREKMRLIRAACTVYGLTMPGDVSISLPNAT